MSDRLSPSEGNGSEAWDRTACDWNLQASTHHESSPLSPRPSAQQEDSDPLQSSDHVTLLDRAQPQSRKGIIAFLIFSIALGALVFFTQPAQQTTTVSSPSPTSARPLPSPRSAGSYEGSIPFASSDVSGIFTVNSSAWEGNTLIANVTIEVHEGSLAYSFIFIDTDDGDISPSDRPRRRSDLYEGILEEGQRITGTIRCTKKRGDTNIILRDRGRNNLTTIRVAG